jgi:hypothetical protein
MTKRKITRLSDHDVQEVVLFQQYLADMHTMPRDEFYHEYQEYMGLSDAELAAILQLRED